MNGASRAYGIPGATNLRTIAMKCWAEIKRLNLVIIRIDPDDRPRRRSTEAKKKLKKNLGPNYITKGKETRGVARNHEHCIPRMNSTYVEHSLSRAGVFEFEFNFTPTNSRRLPERFGTPRSASLS